MHNENINLPSLVVAKEFSGSTCEEEEDETNDIEVVLVLEVLSCSPLAAGNGDSAMGEFTIRITTMDNSSQNTTLSKAHNNARFTREISKWN